MFRLCLCRARSFLYLCLRIFLRRFLITLPTETPASTVEWGPRLSVSGCLSSALHARDGPRRASEHARLQPTEQAIERVIARQEADRGPSPDAELRKRFDPAKMTSLDVYPQVWDEGVEVCEEILGQLAKLRALYKRAAGRGSAMLLWLS